ncbi:hypothetical protein PROVALCAL_01233 [Providencia alcalifaciens DSM 30120]|uniref:Uncharacterized protein n=1 Tax=Providencia alcalifaciens DSM 30120 TaxID=520999 RepID=B6XD16_9GAMM|nr:hypothetical protein PROVALCAL_01233 [Providencia alcalifaciens DSM 30120]
MNVMTNLGEFSQHPTDREKLKLLFKGIVGNVINLTPWSKRVK